MIPKVLTWFPDHWTEECEHKHPVVLHHYGKDGLHYCPTMFIQCSECPAIAVEPEEEPYTCTLWGEKPTNDQ